MIFVLCAIIIADDYVSIVVTSGKYKQNTKWDKNVFLLSLDKVNSV